MRLLISIGTHSFHSGNSGVTIAFQFDEAAGGLTVKLSGEDGVGSELALFGAGIWTDWGTALEGGDLTTTLSADGSIFSTTGDLGLAIAFSLSGEIAELSVTYETIPGIVPEPATAIGMLTGFLCLMRHRRARGSDTV